MQNSDVLEPDLALPTQHKISNQSVLKARRILEFSAQMWLAVLIACQFLFVVYLIFAYANPVVMGNLEGWNGVSTSAFVAGDTLGNIAFGMHVLLAIVMIAGGSLQLIPAIRNKYRKFHRINGRIYVTLALLISTVGIVLIWTRGTVGDTTMHGLTTFSGVVTIICGIMAVTYAVKRNIPVHQVWATRLFIAANGVLYFRIILFGYLVLFGTAGINFETFTGPTVVAISIACYVLPIIVYEFYRRIKAAQQTLPMYAMTAVLSCITLYFALGTFAVTMGNWLAVIS